MNDYHIFKGNLSTEMKNDILDALRVMMDSADANDRKFAITTLLTHKRELSEWPANDWSNSDE